jgi:hypothetical protein
MDSRRLLRGLGVQVLETRAVFAADMWPLEISATVPELPESNAFEARGELQSTLDGLEPSVAIEAERISGLRGATVQVKFDPDAVSIERRNLRPGAAWEGRASLLARVDDEAGLIDVFIFSANPVTAERGSLLDLDFDLLDDLADEQARLIEVTHVQLNEGQLDALPRVVSTTAGGNEQDVVEEEPHSELSGPPSRTASQAASLTVPPDFKPPLSIRDLLVGSPRPALLLEQLSPTHAVPQSLSNPAPQDAADVIPQSPSDAMPQLAPEATFGISGILADVPDACEPQAPLAHAENRPLQLPVADLSVLPPMLPAPVNVAPAPAVGWQPADLWELHRTRRFH